MAKIQRTIGVLLVLAVLTGAPQTALSAEFQVQDYSDDTSAASIALAHEACASGASECTLRGALAAAAASPGSDVIRLGTDVVFPLRAGLAITSDVFLVGKDVVLKPDADVTRKFRIVTIGQKGVSAHVWMQGLEIQGGYAKASGGGLFVDKGSHLVLKDSIVRGNQSERSGGGIAAIGSVVLRNVTVVNNVARSTGGGTLLSGPLDVRAVSILRNRANKGGGLVTEGNGDGRIVRLLVAENVAEKGGGAFFRAENLVVDSAIVRNFATERAGGIEGNPRTRLTLSGVVIVDNRLGPGGIASNCSMIKPVDVVGDSYVGETQMLPGDGGRHKCDATGDGRLLVAPWQADVFTMLGSGEGGADKRIRLEIVGRDGMTRPVSEGSILASWSSLDLAVTGAANLDNIVLPDWTPTTVPVAFAAWRTGQGTGKLFVDRQAGMVQEMAGPNGSYAIQVTTGIAVDMALRLIPVQKLPPADAAEFSLPREALTAILLLVTVGFLFMRRRRVSRA